MLSVLVVCEWSYLSWGQIVATTKDSIVNRDDFVTYEWIDLHCGTYFESVVEYLRSLLDREASYLSDEESIHIRCIAAFCFNLCFFCTYVFIYRYVCIYIYIYIYICVFI